MFDKAKLDATKLQIRWGGSDMWFKCRDEEMDVLILREVFGGMYEDFGLQIYGNVVDVGAHIGIFSSYASMKAAKVVSIEPVKQNFVLLNDNLNRNIVSGCDYYVFKNAVMSREQSVTVVEDVWNSGGGSIFGTENGAGSTKVDAYSLSSFLEWAAMDSVDYLKLDCEGAEYDILLNTNDSFFSCVKQIGMEWHVKDVGQDPAILVSRLHSLGFLVKMVTTCDTAGMLYAKRS